MKKLALSMVAALAIFSVSCSSSDKANDSDSAAKTECADTCNANAQGGNVEGDAASTEVNGDVKAQVIALMTETTANIKANPADVEKIMVEFESKGNAMGLSAADQQALMADAEVAAASQALQMAAMEAASAANNGDGDVEGATDAEPATAAPAL